jgi:hypothetical protein
LKNFYQSPFSKWPPQYHSNSTLSDVNAISYVGRTMLNICNIVAAILKRATSRNCSMSGLTSEHHYLPTYQIVMISDNVEFVWYCGGHDIEQFLRVAIFKMATTISQKINIVRYHRNLICG